MDITSSGVMDITTSGNNSNISIEPHGSGVLQLGHSLGTNNKIEMDAKSFSIDAYANSSYIKLAPSTDGQDLRIELTQSTDSSLVLSSSGTGTDLYKSQPVLEEWKLLQMVSWILLHLIIIQISILNHTVQEQ